VTAPRMSRLPITGPPAYGHGSGGKRVKTLRGPDGEERPRDRAVQGSIPCGSAVNKGFRGEGSPYWTLVGSQAAQPCPPSTMKRLAVSACGAPYGRCGQAVLPCVGKPGAVVGQF
jgi:hypothetical protein